MCTSGLSDLLRHLATTIRFAIGMAVIAVVAACGGNGGGASESPGPVVSIEVLPTALLVTGAGQTQVLKVRALDANGVVVPNAPITFSSSQPAQFSIGNDGVARAEAAIGSAIITISSGNIHARPVLAASVETQPNAVLVSDSQVVTGPQPVPGSISGIGGQYTVSLSGIATPAPGTIMLASGSYPIAGKVVSTSGSTGGAITVTLELVPLNQLVRNASVSGTFSAEQTRQFAKPAGVTTARIASSREKPSAVALGSKTFGPFACAVSFDPNLLNVSLTPTITPSLAFAYDFSVLDGVSKSFLLEFKGSLEASLSGQVTIGAVKGSFDCTAPLWTIPIPITGWFAAFIEPEAPLALVFRFDIDASTNTTYGVSGSIGADVTLGLKYDATGQPININDANVNGQIEFSPAFPNTAARIQLTEFAGLTMGLTVGNVIGKLPNAVELSAGGELSSAWGLPYDASQDPLFTTDYQLKDKFAIGPGPGLQKLLDLFKVALAIDISAAAEFPLGRSPVASSVRLSQNTFKTGDQLLFKVALDPTTVRFPLSLAFYNVQEVRIYVLNHVSQSASQIAAVTAVDGQSDFSVPWTAPSDGAVEVNGKATFFAFAVPKRLDYLRSAFPLELGPVLASSIEVQPTLSVLSPGGVAMFSAYLDGVKATTGVTWTATGGSISASGEFTAGNVPGTYQVQATRVSSGEVATSNVQIQRATLPPSVTSVAVSPGSPLVGGQATFNVSGTNLLPGFSLVFPGCVPTEITSTSSTQRQFACALTQSGTNLQGSVSTGAGVVLFTFTQTVGASAATSDLLAQSVVFTPGTTTAGGNVTVNWSIVNQGSAGAAASTTVVRITNSATSSAGTNLASIGTPAMAAGASASQQAVVAAPATAGTYYVWVVADNSNTAGQATSATGNDIVRAAPALTVSSVSASPTISSVVANPTSVMVGVQATFNVNGTNLQPGYVFSLPGCTATEVSSSSTTQRQFTCTPTKSGTNLAGSVSSATGTVLYSFVQTVNPSGSSGFQAGRVAAGSFHSCAITGSGGVKCWGYNAEGSLGDGTQQNRLTPVDVVGLGSGVTAITTFDVLTCALTNIGGVKCWGPGIVGDGTSPGPGLGPHLTPTDVVGLSSGIIAISAGEFHACAVTATGGAKCWGSNLSGALGDGTWNDRLTPVDVAGLTSGVAAISAGDTHTCALTSAGGVKCWGTNVNGAIGDGTTADRLVPTPVVGLASGVVAISAGTGYTCALTSVGGVKCWGNSFWGSLGDGTAQQPRLVPVDVVGLGIGVGAIATSASGGDADHSCANLVTGGVKCWGNNGYGALGDGTIQNRLTPVDVVGLGVGASGISAGFLHTCALTKVGGIKCWGSNSRGGLGDGTTQDRLTPVDVVGF